MSKLKLLIYIITFYVSLSSTSYGAKFKYSKCHFYLTVPSGSGANFHPSTFDSCRGGKTDFSLKFKLFTRGPFKSSSINYTYTPTTDETILADTPLDLSMTWIGRGQTMLPIGRVIDYVVKSTPGQGGKWDMRPYGHTEINAQANIDKFQVMEELNLWVDIPTTVYVNNSRESSVTAHYDILQSATGVSGDGMVRLSVALTYDRMPNQLNLAIEPSNLEILCTVDRLCTGEAKLALTSSDGPAPVACGVDGFRHSDLRVRLVGGGQSTDVEPGGAPVRFDGNYLPEKIMFDVLNAQPGTSRVERVNLTCSIV